MKPRKPTLADKDVAFRRYYSQNLKPLEQRFEDLRRKAVREHKLRIVTALASWLGALALFEYLARPVDESWWFIAVFGVISGIGLGVWAWLPAGVHNLRLKDQIMSRIVPFFGDLQYRSEPNLDPDQYLDWMLVPPFSKVYSEDQIEGVYRGVPIKFAELSLKDEESSAGSDHSQLIKVFKGLMIDLELDEEFTGVTLIRSRGSDMNGRFRLDQTLSELSSDSGFEVFGTPGCSGTELASSWFLKRLAKVSALFEARQTFASFHQNRLVILIDHKGDYFEMSHRQHTDFARDAERVRDELGRFFGIVDLLELRGKIEDNEKQTINSVVSELPAIEEANVADSYDAGGWGCFSSFVIYTVTTAIYLYLLGDELSDEELMWWSMCGGFLLFAGLWQLMRGVTKFSIGSLIFSLILLAGAFTVFYYNVPSSTQILIQSRVPFELPDLDLF